MCKVKYIIYRARSKTLVASVKTKVDPQIMEI